MQVLLGLMVDLLNGKSVLKKSQVALSNSLILLNAACFHKQ